ncbi:MAG: hypothetical protein RM021_026110 [Nostoc sp. EkiNYC01]|nr:hypothetical protein [Nostoc sp. EkiNYC01]
MDKTNLPLLNINKYHDALSLTVLTFLGNHKEAAMKSQFNILVECDSTLDKIARL